jgi:hypothetical protein
MLSSLLIPLDSKNNTHKSKKKTVHFNHVHAWHELIVKDSREALFDLFGWKTERGALDCFAFVLFALFPYPPTLFGVACRAQFLFFEGLNQIFGYVGLPLFFGCMIEKRNFKKQTKRTKTCYFGEVWGKGLIST